MREEEGSSDGTRSIYPYVLSEESFEEGLVFVLIMGVVSFFFLLFPFFA